MSPQVILATVTGLSLASAIVIFFWSIDTMRQDRMAVQAGAKGSARTGRITALGFMDRYLKPLAEVMNERNRRRGRVTLADRLGRAGLRLSSSEFLMIQLTTTLVLSALGILIFGIGAAVLILGGIGFLAPSIYLGTRQGARQAAFDAQLGNLVTLLSNSIKTGYSLVQAIETVARKSAPPVSDEFERVISAIQFGASVEDALAALVARVQNPDLDFIVIAILLHRKVGGNLAEILDNIGETIRERLRMKREMRVVTAHARASSRVISALPIVLALLMYLITPRYFQPMITNPIGWVMIALAVVLVISGNLIMGRMTRMRA